MARNVGLQIPYDGVWKRVKEATGWTKDKELAEFLDVQPGTISGAKQRDSFPIQWAFKVGQKFRCSTDYLMTGVGCVTKPVEYDLNELESPADEFLQDIDKRLSELEKEDPGYRTWFRIEFKRKFPGLMRGKEEAIPEVDKVVANQNVA